MEHSSISKQHSELNADWDQLLSNQLDSVLESNELNLLYKHSPICTFLPGETLLHQGEKSSGIYMILSGTVVATAKVMSESMVHLETLHAGQFLTSIAINQDYFCTTTLIAEDTVQCIMIPNRYFELLAIDYPETKYKIVLTITQQLCIRLKTIHDKVATAISDTNMVCLSFFERMIHSLYQPKKISLAHDVSHKAMIQNLPIFNVFTKAEMDVLCNNFVMQEAPKNCQLEDSKEKNAACYLIVYGAVQSCILQDNKLAKLSIIGPGSILANLECVEKQLLFNFKYITCEQTVICKLSEAALSLIKDNHPELWYKLFDLLCCSLTELKKSVDKLSIRLKIENYNR